MVLRLITWAVHNPFVVILLAAALAGFGGFAFFRVNVEAYPDPAPAIIEVVAQYPGASAEEVERQVTIPLEVALAGIPGLKYTRSKSLFGLAYLNNQFEHGINDNMDNLWSHEHPSVMRALCSLSAEVAQGVS
jgi:cobalt-zinc-cadmium resistance protein CzcA